MISFDNTKTAFEYKNDKELKKAYLLFKLIGMPTLSSIGMKMATLGLKLNLPITGMIKSTVFDQFCGGETISDSEKTMNKLAKYGVHSLLDYSVEGKESESDFNSCSKMIQKTIAIAKDNDHIPFAVFKVTGVMRFALLEKLNAKETLTEEETLEYEKAYKRIDAICKKGFNLGVPVMIDAEESWIQDAIDEIVEEMMAKYNKAKAVIYNTVQMYRHDRLTYLKESHDRSKDGGYFIGVKIVRGAYMEKERARAIEKGYESPIQPNKDATDRDYNLALEYTLENHAGISICAGTHNEYSSLILTQLLDKYGVEKDNSTVYFAQLLGMSDHISFNLSKEHYRVVKYVPFGPVKDVMPYLIRRAEENTSISGQSSRELLLLKKEKQRRKI